MSIRHQAWTAFLLGILATGCSASPTQTGDDAESGVDDAIALDDLTTDAAPTECSAAWTCGACATVAGCGWCQTTSQCLLGGPAGSNDGTCVGSGWDFTGDSCSVGPPPDAGAGPDVVDAGARRDASGTDSARGCVATVPAGGEATDTLCANGIDDDCDGFTDCTDFNCSRNSAVTVCRTDAGVRDSGAADSGTRDAGTTGVIGPTGGTVDLLHFAAFGDVRPPNDNDTAGYPTSIVDSVMTDMADLGAQFAVASGDYMFASSGSAVNAQLDLFLAAEQRFGRTVFHGMGNHECTGSTASNCPLGNETPNVAAYLSRLASAYGKPYFDWVIHTSLGDAHFIAAAPNAWDTAQHTWLRTALGRAATYTFVIAHEPPTGTMGPGSATIDSLIAARATPVTMILYGHTHEYRHIATNAVIDGNAGAPLAGTGGHGDYYGFATIDQRADGNVVFTAYQIGNPPMVIESFVLTPTGVATQ